MPKTALVLLAEGFEETEAVAAIDILRRGGVLVTVCSIADKLVKGSRGIIFVADKVMAEIDSNFDALVLPGGGKGSQNLAASQAVNSLIKEMFQAKRIIAAICAAPALVLGPLGILEGKDATCFPDMAKDLGPRVRFQDKAVVVDGSIITSQGVGTALVFGLAIVEKLAGKEISEKVRAAALVS